METTLYEGWTILELLGHRRLAGYVREETRFGTGLIRIDIPDAAGGATTQYYSPSALYAMTPTTEELARAFATRHQPTPIQRWELPAARDSQTVDIGEVSLEYDCELEDDEE